MWAVQGISTGLAAGPWGLVEFAPETTTLEEVFREVVLQEARA
jgi:hypothetical protein